MPEENTPEGTGKRIGKEILSFVLYFVIVIAAMLLIIHYVGQRTEVSGSSMENTSVSYTHLTLPTTERV